MYAKNKFPILMLVFSLIVLLIASCSNLQTGGVAPESSTGIAELDNIISAALAGDSSKLQPLLEFTQIACTNSDGLGGPPKCMTGEAEGTPVEVLPILSSEGTFLKKSELDSWTLDVSNLYAAYQVADTAWSDENYPTGEYALVFTGDAGDPTSVTLQVKEGRIVRIDYGFSNPPEISPDLVEKYLIEPATTDTQ